jgi:hypothetical protein
MAEAGEVQREWLLELLPAEARMRCSYRRRGRRILQYTVQLEIFHSNDWRPVVRFDNAHGFCHRDDIHPDGSQDKTAMFVGDANDTFTLAIKEVQTGWESHRTRFLGEIKS